MSRFDSFFEAPDDQKLRNKILEKSAAELAIQRQSLKRRRFIAWFAPSLAALAASLVIVKFSYFMPSDVPQPEELAQLDDVDAENLELFEDMTLLEDLDDLELIEDESLEEG